MGLRGLLGIGIYGVGVYGSLGGDLIIRQDIVQSTVTSMYYRQDTGIGGAIALGGGAVLMNKSFNRGLRIGYDTEAGVVVGFLWRN